MAPKTPAQRAADYRKRKRIISFGKSKKRISMCLVCCDGSASDQFDE